MTPVGRPFLATIVAVVLSILAVLLAQGALAHIAAGGEISGRAAGAPALLVVVALLAVAFAAMRWVQRVRYVRATTPEERTAAAAAKKREPRTPPLAAGAVDYGERLDDAER